MLRMVQQQEVVREGFYSGIVRRQTSRCVTQSTGFFLSSPADITTEQRRRGFRKESVVGQPSSFGCLVDAYDRTVSSGKPVYYPLRVFAWACW
jgi:hypothetical protein